MTLNLGRASQHRIIITRAFNAPGELVWRAWTELDHLLRWFCPRDFTVLFAQFDVRPGGAWRSGMRSPDGHEYVHHGVYRQVSPPRRLERGVRQPRRAPRRRSGADGPAPDRYHPCAGCPARDGLAGLHRPRAHQPMVGP